MSYLKRFSGKPTSFYDKNGNRLYLGDKVKFRLGGIDNIVFGVVVDSIHYFNTFYIQELVSGYCYRIEGNPDCELENE